MRISLIDERSDAKLPEIFAHIKKTRGVLSYVLHSLGHAAEGLRAFAAYGEYVRYHTALSGRESEFAILALALGNQYAWSHHVPSALKAGVTQPEVDALHDGKAAPTLSARELAAVEYAREFANLGRVGDAAFNKARAEFGERGIADLSLLCGYFMVLASMVNAFQLELEPYYKPLMRPM